MMKSLLAAVCIAVSVSALGPGGAVGYVATFALILLWNLTIDSLQP